MTGPRPKAPGWYPEPDILPGSSRVVRYWNGRHWTDRRRPVPTLANLELGGPGMPHIRALEGPVRVVELPALAAEITVTRDGASGRSDTRERSTSSDLHGVDLPTTTGGGRVPPRPPSVGGGDGGGDGGDGGGSDGQGGGARAASGRRRKWWFFAIAAVACAVMVILTGEALRPPSPGPKVLTDNQFIRMANDECAATLPALRPADGGQMPSAITPALAATNADQAAIGLENLANKLAALPAAAADQPHIAAWLAGWHQYATIGHQYAADLRRTGGAGKQPAYLTTAAHLASASDRFSQANGLTKCLFAYVYQASPSDF